jgi:hypothetical protein
VIEEPTGGGQDVGLVATDFIDYLPYVFARGGGHDAPFVIGVPGYLGMQGRKGQRRVGIRAIEVYPKNLHESVV